MKLKNLIEKKFKPTLAHAYKKLRQKLIPVCQKYLNITYAFLKEQWKKKYIKISCISVVFIVVVFISLPSIVFFFTPLSEESKLMIAKIEKKISEKKKKYEDKKKEYEGAGEANYTNKKNLLERNIKTLQMKIQLFQIKKGRYPTQKEIKRVLYPVLIEPFSYSKHIQFERNEIGGWYYNATTGRIAQNFK